MFKAVLATLAVASKVQVSSEKWLMSSFLFLFHGGLVLVAQLLLFLWHFAIYIAVSLDGGVSDFSNFFLHEP